MKIGIIGLGEQTVSQLLPALDSVPQSVTIQAICDSNKSAMLKVAEQFPKAHQYDRYQSLLKTETSLDAVLVCVPHFLYEEICALALEKGIAVIKEKPLAVNVSGAQKLARVSAHKSVPIYTITKRQFFQSYQLAQQWLKRIGVVYQYGAYHYISVGNLYSGWRSDPKLAGGGVFGDMGYHLIDVLVRLFGPVKKAALVSTNQGKPELTYTVEDAASALFVHQNGVKGSFQLACLCGPKDERLEIRGSKGAIIVNKTTATLYSVHGKKLDQQEFTTSGDAATTECFKEFITQNPQLMQDNLDQNLAVVEAIAIAYQNQL